MKTWHFVGMDVAQIEVMYRCESKAAIWDKLSYHRLRTEGSEGESARSEREGEHARLMAEGHVQEKHPNLAYQVFSPVCSQQTVSPVMVHILFQRFWDHQMGSQAPPLWTMHCLFYVHILAVWRVLLVSFRAWNSSTVRTTTTNPATTIRMRFSNV